MQIGSYSPWGKIQHIEKIAPGIAHVSTAGHGGFKLDRAQNALVPKPLRRKGGWYEEDCAYAAVAVTFHQGAGFSCEAVEIARRTLKDYYPDQYTEAFGEPVTLEESGVLRDRAAFEARRDQLVSVAGYGSWHETVPSGMVGVVAHKGGRDGAGRVHGPAQFFLVPEEEYKAARRNGVVVDPARHPAWSGPKQWEGVTDAP